MPHIPSLNNNIMLEMDQTEPKRKFTDTFAEANLTGDEISITDGITEEDMKTKSCSSLMEKSYDTTAGSLNRLKTVVLSYPANTDIEAYINPTILIPNSPYLDDYMQEHTEFSKKKTGLTENATPSLRTASQKTWKRLLILMGFLSALLFCGSAYSGWQFLVTMFTNENTYGWLCVEDPGDLNSFRNPLGYCNRQREAIQFLYTIAFSMNYFFNPVSAMLNEWKGPKFTAFIGAISLIAGWSLIGISSQQVNFFIPGMILIGGSTDLLSYPSLSAVALFPKNRSSLVGSLFAAQYISWWIPGIFYVVSTQFPSVTMNSIFLAYAFGVVLPAMTLYVLLLPKRSYNIPETSTLDESDDAILTSESKFDKSNPEEERCVPMHFIIDVNESTTTTASSTVTSTSDTSESDDESWGKEGECVDLQRYKSNQPSFIMDVAARIPPRCSAVQNEDASATSLIGATEEVNVCPPLLWNFSPPADTDIQEHLMPPSCLEQEDSLTMCSTVDPLSDNEESIPIRPSDYDPQAVATLMVVPYAVVSPPCVEREEASALKTSVADGCITAPLTAASLHLVMAETPPSETTAPFLCDEEEAAIPVQFLKTRSTSFLMKENAGLSGISPSEPPSVPTEALSAPSTQEKHRFWKLPSMNTTMEKLHVSISILHQLLISLHSELTPQILTVSFLAYVFIWAWSVVRLIFFFSASEELLGPAYPVLLEGVYFHFCRVSSSGFLSLCIPAQEAPMSSF
ncbi:hypothetical protein IE077_000597 [Cardiosporidium cionae]|uniref:Uncharacterized protein n=1 Tax=Cardiosporidium cionae TaxID=476202 RepID=A0ABQ7JEK9_9APIC|nr:hypothetical protein IE077_000597 [Cardiosporidium cionae]|eukprot:KAF8822436.1 hypothetical protein IE077_000597 [Cardiosporidium cionae]